MVIAIVAAVLTSGAREHYQLPLVFLPLSEAPNAIATVGDLAVDDALHHPDACAVIAALFDEGAELVDGSEAITFHGVPSAAIPPGPARPLDVQQSHSSFVVGDAAVVKTYRHLEPGDGPELEMTRFLCAHGFPSVPPLLGWCEVAGGDLKATLGIAQAYVDDGVDGWQFVRDALANDPAVLPAAMAELGGVVGRMHAVLGSDHDNPDFSPEVKDPVHLDLTLATIDEEIREAYAAFGDDPDLDPLRGREAELREHVRALAAVDDLGRAIRVHGDLHLGQALIDESGAWWIIDFEGEPARAMRDRRRRRSPLRDVAGLSRSLSYACAVAGCDGIAVADGAEGAMRVAMLRGYLDGVDPVLLPVSQASTDTLLHLFEVEKAVYELRYEMAYRPDWVRIPVAALVRVLDGP